MLVFGLGEERFAMEALRVTEVVPSVPLRVVPGAPAFVAGLLAYRGKVLPVLDLLQLMKGHRCRNALSTRVIVVDCAAAGEPPRLLGLRAECVTETMRLNGSDLVPAGINHRETLYLGGTIRDERGMILQLHPEKLVAEEVFKKVLSAAEEEG